ncbi:hypothetical protein [Taibaiella koreensis]|uniref:hypothetical protein n=1 Tax=Taibaiella koreensis TaxID=1268548 RepID=UPI000E59EAEB|nr:hypothetical protein [Taibaiella koreensis]
MSAALVCKAHGTVIRYLHVCQHLYNSYKEEAVPEALEVHFKGTLRLCVACYTAYEKQHFPEHNFYDLVGECLEHDDPGMEQKLEDLSGLYETYCKAIGEHYFCGHCFDELRIRNARRLGQPLPFIPYEQTLDHRDTDTLGRLETYLTGHFTFATSEYIRPGEPALFLRQGNISSPLEIAIYHVTEAHEQEALLQLIDHFFASIEKFQRRVCFFEKETWIETQYENGVGRTWVPEAPLKAILIS